MGEGDFMAEEGKGGMTRRDFLGIATAGLGATAGGVVASLVTRQIDKTVESEGVGATGGTTGVEGNGKATDPLADLPSDNVGASDAVPSSVADTEATDVEVEAPSETIRYDIVDSHLHYVDFIQRSDGFAALTDAMDLAGVSRAVIFGLGIAKQWDEDVDRAPKYYLSNDSRCYYYSGTDFIVAEELLAQPAEVRDRFLPFCCGINGNDRFAAEHIRQLLRLYPKFWRGIGEIMSRHDDLTALTYGEPPHLDHPAFKGVFDLGAEEGLPVLVHHYNRDGGIVLDDLQHEVHAAVVVADVQRAHSLGPNFHLLVLLLVEVARQQVGRHERGDGNYDCCHHEKNLRLTDAVGPLHGCCEFSPLRSDGVPWTERRVYGGMSYVFLVLKNAQTKKILWRTMLSEKNSLLLRSEP
jgi:hypothetical protein